MAQWRRLPRLTDQGRVYLILMLVTTVLAYKTGNSLFFLILAMLWSIFIGSFLLSRWMLRGLSLSRVVPEYAYSTMPLTVRLTVHNAKRWLPAFALSVTDHAEGRDQTVSGRCFLLCAGNRGQASCHYEVRFFRRGQYRFRGATIETAFPFGLFRAAVEVSAASTLLVYPELWDADLKQLEPRRVRESGMRSSVTQGGDTFRSLHEYRFGDNSRLIHWRVSARASRLMVKDLDQDQARNYTVILDTHTQAVPKKFRRHILERGVSLAATLAQKLPQEGFGVELLCFAPGLCHIDARGRRRQLRAMLDVLAMLEPADRPLDDLLRGLPRSVARSRIIVIALSDAGGVEFHRQFPDAARILVDSPEVRAMFRRRSTAPEAPLDVS